MRKEAEQFEASLQQAAQGTEIAGRLAPLVHTAQLVSSLAELPPPPPNQLATGRRQFLAEAARLRATRATHRGAAWGLATMRPVGILVAAVLVFGILFGIGQAVAASLPGEPLYAFKLTTEAIRVQWTASPESRADLAAALVDKRLDEIVTLVEQGQAVDELIADGARKQLALALQAVYQVENQERVRASQRLESTLQVQEQAMMRATSTLSDSQQEPVRDLLEEIRRVRQELRSGQEESGGEQHRLRPGMPLDTQDTQDSGGQPGHAPSSQPDHSPVAPEIDEDTGSGPGPQPADKPAGPQPTGDPRSGSGPQPDDEPARPKPTKDPASGPGPQSDDKPAEPQPKEDPGSGPSPQTDDKPSGSQPNEGPGASPSPQPDGDPGSAPGQQPTEPPGGQDSEPPHDSGTGNGSKKP